jgi:hypothetical protein
MNCIGLVLGLLITASALSCRASGGGTPVQPKGPEPAARCDFLSPLPSPVTDPGYRAPPEYDEALSMTLFHRVIPTSPDGGELMMVMLKDAVPEAQEAVYVLAPRRGAHGDYRVVHARARGRVPQGGPAAGAEYFEAVIDREAVLQVERVWTAMTGSARWRIRDEILPLKPTHAMHAFPTEFIFDYWGNHVFSQGISSAPDAEGCVAVLVAVGHDLMRLADEVDQRNRSNVRHQMLRRVGILSERLGLSAASDCAGSPCRAALR